MLTVLVRNWALVMAFASRDFATRYRNSLLGWTWSLVQPLATVLIFTAVFTVVFRVQAPPLGSDPSKTSFVAFLFSGLVVWNLFNGILLLSMTQLKANADLLRKVHFPAWAPILGATLVQLVQVGLELVVLTGVFVWERNIGVTWLLAVPVLVGTALFAQGIGFLLAIPYARYDDVQYIVTVVLSALYFLTPVLYPISLIENTASWLVGVIEANPMTWFVVTIHQVMYSLEAPSWWVTPALLAFGVTVFWIGLSVFNRASKDIAEQL